MLKISTGFGYTIIGIIRLAMCPPGVSLTGQEIADACSLPAPRRVLNTLGEIVRAGYLRSRSHRTHGGFSLAYPASRITLLDLIEVANGMVQLHPIIGQEAHENPQEAALAEALGKAQQAMVEVLRNNVIGRHYETR